MWLSMFWGSGIEGEMMLWVISLIWVLSLVLDIFILTPMDRFKIEKESECSIDGAFRETRVGERVFCGKFEIYRKSSEIVEIKRIDK